MLFHGFHKPLGSACRSGYTNSFRIFEQACINFENGFYKISAFVFAFAHIVQDFAVGRIFARYKENYIVALSEFFEALNSSVDVFADCIFRFEIFFLFILAIFFFDLIFQNIADFKKRRFIHRSL
jgi:hypothetical protein